MLPTPLSQLFTFSRRCRVRFPAGFCNLLARLGKLCPLHRAVLAAARPAFCCHRPPAPTFPPLAEQHGDQSTRWCTKLLFFFFFSFSKVIRILDHPDRSRLAPWSMPLPGHDKDLLWLFCRRCHNQALENGGSWTPCRFPPPSSFFFSFFLSKQLKAQHQSPADMHLQLLRHCMKAVCPLHPLPKTPACRGAVLSFWRGFCPLGQVLSPWPGSVLLFVLLATFCPLQRVSSPSQGSVPMLGFCPGSHVSSLGRLPHSAAPSLRWLTLHSCSLTFGLSQMHLHRVLPCSPLGLPPSSSQTPRHGGELGGCPSSVGSRPPAASRPAQSISSPAMGLRGLGAVPYPCSMLPYGRG
ncbi:uncharacterized protein LOC128077046 [Tympanuchus pallidicinctus]|uniref:uncharacterized protein LOC128077046 n=1 Tax=Tympanuchus pallidicinctus TaxID=109042 RepID=UPI0022873B87|nr:uncharacterized protein LOC128077046 [Tympanuchus pallidicinctus]XP_052531643.1 uncharacterized protein LOC128077046 [Tympanuchus pallidicinctus]